MSIWSVACLACDCDVNGTVPGTTCAAYGGQCQCLVGVSGRRCDYCLPGFYSFSATGCSRTYILTLTSSIRRSHGGNFEFEAIYVKT